MTTVQETLRKQAANFLQIADQAKGEAKTHREQMERCEVDETQYRLKASQFIEAADKLDSIEG